MEALKQMNVAGIPVKGIVHVGANTGQERDEYKAANITPVVYVEPIDEVYAQLKTNLNGFEGHIPVQALCSEEAGQLVRFNISSNSGESSSMMELGYHASLFPDVHYTSHKDMTTTTVDIVVDRLRLSEIPNLLVIDTQGADLKVLRGASKMLEHSIDGVFVEVSEVPLYEGGCTFDEVTAFLAAFGFRLRWLSIHGLAHGDGFYCKLAGRRSYEVEPELSIIEALALLTPYDVNLKKERLGPPKDGGYIFLAELFNKRPVFSYGINGEYQFDVEMAKRGHKIYMFDHTIDGISNPDNDENLKWICEGVAGAYDPTGPLNTIDYHLNTYAENEHDLILKMDIEGHEYECFDALPELSLRRFQQMSFEIHNLHSLNDIGFRKRFVRVLKKINRHFTLFHVHANNFDGADTYTFMSGIPVSNLLELSYVRSDLVIRSASKTIYPTSLDCPNVHPHDKKLWFFPFLPTTAGSAEFVTEERRLNAQAALRNG
jgi:FkbM family methyltransferase